jgi:hypothetical protein
MKNQKFQKGQIVRLSMHPETHLRVVDVYYSSSGDLSNPAYKYECRYVNPDGSIMKDIFLEIELEVIDPQ